MWVIVGNGAVEEGERPLLAGDSLHAGWPWTSNAHAVPAGSRNGSRPYIVRGGEVSR